MARHSTDASLRAPHGTQSVERAFALLRAFTDDQRVWTLADLSRARGLTKPTTLRLLGVLEREGMLQRTTPPGGYRLGAAAIALGALAQRANDLPTAARGEIEALMRATGETVSLEILAGREIMILDEVRGRFRGSWSESVGSRWPAHAAATGKVLLAAERVAGSPAWRHYSATGRGRLPRFTERTITTMTRLLAELDQVQRQGYATAVEELEQGYVAIGAPVRDHAARVVAAICLGGPVTRLSPRRVATLVRQVTQAAHAISTGLGAQGSRMGIA